MRGCPWTHEGLPLDTMMGSASYKSSRGGAIEQMHRFSPGAPAPGPTAWDFVGWVRNGIHVQNNSPRPLTERAGRRARVGGKTAAVGGVVAALAMMLAQDVPDGKQRGVLTYITKLADYIHWAKIAEDYGHGGFGANVFTAEFAKPPVVTAPGAPNAGVPYYVNPPPQVVVEHAAKIADQAQEQLGLVGDFYAGKHSVYGAELFDVGSWGADSLDRLRKHHGSAKGWRFACVIAAFRDEHAALRAEQAVQEQLAAKTGLRSTHKKYQTGPLAKNGDGFVVYLLLR